MRQEISIGNDSLLSILWDSPLFGVAIINSTGEIIKANDSCTNILGIDQNLVGLNFIDSFPDGFKNKVLNEFDTALRNKGQSNRLTGNFINHRGDEKSIDIKFLYLKDSFSVISIIEDNTCQKNAIKEIEKAREKVEESDRLKAAFLANMSHEIRTPMNGIIGFSGMLLDPELTEEKRKQFVEIIISSSNQLVELINDIINLSKIEARNVEIINKEFYLNNLMDEIYSFFATTATSKGIIFKYNSGLPLGQSKILSDEKKLKQVITNLLSNAFKFTHEGSVSFSYTISGKEIQFQIYDTGIGIESKNYTTIFERFRQADDSNTRQYGGTGLGLSISKSYIEFLGGRIWLQSKLKEGTTFYFTIPYHPIVIPELTERVTTISTPDWSNKTILVAEDEEINYLYITEVLTGTNVNLLIARNGLEAVEIVKTTEQIDLILMDIKMPELNGYEATKIIKQIRPNIPIIAQTAYAMAGDREIALSEGCDDYISKPVKKDKLLSVLLNYL